MPHNPVLDSPLTNGSISPSLPSPIPARSGLSPERSAALLARAKDILAGRLRPDPLPGPLWADERLQRDFGDKSPPPTPEAIRRIKEDWALQSQYRGDAVACFTMADGNLAVLAVGLSEIRELLSGLSDNEDSRVVILDTDPF